MPIGAYRDWAVILPRVLAAADGTGEEVESWPDPPADPTSHAAQIEGPGGGEQVGPPRQSFDGLRLRFRCVVDLAAVDRVKLQETDDVYAVVGVWRDRAKEGRGWQTVADLAGPVG